MRSIYLVMSQTGTILSKTIKLFTGKKYNHISLSLDDDLNCMYSFGRKYPDIPFIGVFVEEGINKGTFKKFKETKCKIIKIDLTEEQYYSICTNIEKMIMEKEKYKYNLLGLFLALFHIQRNSENKFFCSEFIRYILDKASVDVSMIPAIAPHPTDFEDMDNTIMYEGLLRKYTKRWILCTIKKA